MEKTIIFLLLLVSCVEATNPNITLEVVEESTLSHRNTYSYWSHRMDLVNDSVYFWGDKLCNEGIVVDYDTYEYLSYESVLCFEKASAMYGLIIEMYGLYTYCDCPNEASKIKVEYDFWVIEYLKLKERALVADKVILNLKDYVQPD